MTAQAMRQRLLEQTELLAGKVSEDESFRRLGCVVADLDRTVAAAEARCRAGAWVEAVDVLHVVLEASVALQPCLRRLTQRVEGNARRQARRLARAAG